VPATVDAIVQRAMAKDLAKRYARWEDFSAELAAAFRSEHFGARKAQEFADSDRFETLRRLPFFENFSDAELWEVARISTWRHARTGEALMREGEPGDYFCILAQGEVTISKHGKLLNLLRPASRSARWRTSRRRSTHAAPTSPWRPTRASSRCPPPS
jgi:hypothetical protein